VGARQASSGPAARWDLLAAVCLERPPRLTPALVPIQQRTVDILARKELEESLLSDHELRHRRDLARQERKRKGEAELDNSEASVTALDVEDGWRKTAEGFQPAERGPGEAAGLQSVRRKPDLPLRLAVHYRLGSEEVWDLPWAKHSAGETLRETAERAVISRLGPELEFNILGNAPWSFFKHKYPRHYRASTGSEGVKVWIFKGLLQCSFHSEPVVTLQPGLLDYQWLSREEMAEKLNRTVYRAVDAMLHEDGEEDYELKSRL